MTSKTTTDWSYYIASTSSTTVTASTSTPAVHTAARASITTTITGTTAH